MNAPKKFAITAGHSDAEPGNTWNGHREADLMLQLRDIVAGKLREKGHEVLEDGRDKQNLPLRDAIALVSQVDIAIELHTNALTEKSSGVEVVAASQHSFLAQRLAKSIGDVLEIPLRRQGGWYPLDQHIRDRNFTAGFCRAGGLIVEVFFQSNKQELERYLSRYYLVASAIANTLSPSST